MVDKRSDSSSSTGGAGPATGTVERFELSLGQDVMAGMVTQSAMAWAESNAVLVAITMEGAQGARSWVRIRVLTPGYVHGEQRRSITTAPTGPTQAAVEVDYTRSGDVRTYAGTAGFVVVSPSQGTVGVEATLERLDGGSEESHGNLQLSVVAEPREEGASSSSSGEPTGVSSGEPPGRSSGAPGSGGDGASSTPLVLDLDGDGKFGFTSARGGVLFDVDANGAREQTAWTRAQDASTAAFLTLDRNGNGVVDSGLELFGNQHGAANGFDELARHDANHDGRVDARDPVFARLRLWQDLNGDGVSSTEELRTLAQRGVAAIPLGYLDSTQRDAAGNGLFQQGRFERVGGGHGVMVDVWLLAVRSGPSLAAR